MLGLFLSWVKEKIVIPANLKPKQREMLGEAVVEYIRVRTLSGKDKNNRKFSKYSANYAKEKGVSRDSVDLFLDGELLESLKVLSHKRGELIIGYDKEDDALNGKAEGNILGTYGQSEPIPGKKRDFLGITKGDLKGVLNEFENQREVDLSEQDIDALARNAARELLGIDFDEDN